MDLRNIKKIIEKGIKGSGEKQVQVFMSSAKSIKFFKEAIRESKK